MVLCPNCRGHLVYSIRGLERCPVCGGADWVTEEHAARLAEGRRLREDRIRRGLSLREEAARLGITPEALSDREHGRR